MPDVISMTWSEWQESRAVKRANLARLGLDMPSRRETDHGTAGRRLRKAFAGLRVPKFAKEPSGRAVSMSVVLALFGFVSALSAQTTEIKLPAPTKTGGMPVVQAIAERKTSRAFSERELPLATLSTLLWVADGISRPDGRRTIPTGHNVQDLDVYVILKTGAQCREAVLSDRLLSNITWQPTLCYNTVSC